MIPALAVHRPRSSLSSACMLSSGVRRGDGVRHPARARLRPDCEPRSLDHPVDVDPGVPDRQVGLPAHSSIAVRYAAAVASTILRTLLVEIPFAWPATAKLAASRLTSHSNGPGRVSSKSLTSKTSRRSGEANTPKLDRWASPQSCAMSPDLGVLGEIRCHQQRRASVIGERRASIRP